MKACQDMSLPATSSTIFSHIPILGFQPGAQQEYAKSPPLIYNHRVPVQYNLYSETTQGKL